MNLACDNCKYWVPSLESYCRLSPGTLYPSNIHTCIPLIKKINQIYFNRFLKEHHIEDKKLIANCKKILEIIQYIALDELIYAMVDNRGPFVEFLWLKKDKEDCGFSIKVFKEEIYIQIYQMEKYKIHTYESFGTSLHLNMKDFKEKEPIVRSVLWPSIAIYLQRHANIKNANQKIQDIFKSKVKKDK